MSLQAKTFLNFLAGIAAGFLAWVLTDLTGWFADVLTSGRLVSPYDPKYLLYGAVFGGILGLLLGIVDALSLDSQRQMWITVVVGGAVGFAGGWIGLAFGQMVYGNLLPRGFGNSVDAPGLFFIQLFARGLGYAVIGAVVGAAQGASRRSVVIARQGAFGGFAGGLIGGLSFQIIATIFAYIPHIAVLSRLAALVATGALVGFFVGLVQNLFKQAWIRVVLGKNEGKEYLIAKPVTTIGRSELSDIGLFGDKNIAPTHAVIEALPAQRRHRLRHVAGGQGTHAYPATVVNGQPVTAEQWLADGDTIQIGKRTLLFQEKATRGMPRPSPAAPATPARPPVMTRVVGEELLSPGPARPSTSATSGRPSLTPPADVLDQMGSVPEASPSPGATLFPPPLSGPGGPGPAPDATVVMGPGAAPGGIGTRLVATHGPFAGQSFPLSHAPTTLGRAPDRDIALSADSSVSRRQARITYEGGRHVVADDGSSNGTYVNGRRIAAPQPLGIGDVVQFGETSLRYE